MDGTVSTTFGLFDQENKLELLNLADAEVRYQRCFYDDAEAKRQFVQLQKETPWRQDSIKVWGKEHLQPRLTAWHGDHGAGYTYSGLRMEPQPWSALLLSIKADLEVAAGTRFNSVLINLYRDERDSVGWHSDDETELGKHPVIASLSLGATRTFKMKHKARKQEKVLQIDLTHGSLLVMSGSTQQFWMHAVDKERVPTQPRINLTFRTIYPQNQG